MAQSNNEYSFANEMLEELLKTAKPIEDFTEDDYKYLETFPQAIEMKMIEEPQKIFKFRFVCQTKPKDGCLRGITSTKHKLKTYPKIAIQFPSSNVVDGQFFVRCTLHQMPEIAGESSYISPHLLWRRSNADRKFCTSETTFFPLKEEEPNLYTFTLEDFVIISTSRKDWQNVIMLKLKNLKKQDLGKVDLSEEEEKEMERMVDKQICKPQDKVRICFEVFQKHKSNESFIPVVGPFYSSSIANGKAPKIDRICNNSGLMNEITEITLLVSEVKPNDRIIISERKEDINANEQNNNNENVEPKIIPLQVPMLNDVKNIRVITFQMPIYGGHRYNLERISCKIQLERMSDGALSNVQNFDYIHELRRR